MSRYQRVEMCPEFVEVVLAAGGIPVAQMVWKYGHHVAIMLVSDDPSEATGQLERHISVSASSAGIRRPPKHGELIYAAEAMGWEWGECETLRGKDAVVFISRNI